MVLEKTLECPLDCKDHIGAEGQSASLLLVAYAVVAAIYGHAAHGYVV